MNYLSLSLSLLLVAGWAHAQDLKIQEKQEQPVALTDLTGQHLQEQQHVTQTADFDAEDFDNWIFANPIEYHDPSRIEIIINYLLSMAASIPGALELALKIKNYWQDTQAEAPAQEEAIAQDPATEAIEAPTEPENNQPEEQVQQQEL